MGRTIRNWQPAGAAQRWAMWVVFCCAAMAPGWASAQAQAPQDPRLEQPWVVPGALDFQMPAPDKLRKMTLSPALRACVAGLADQNYEARERSLRRLVELVKNKDELHALLVDDQIGPEQRYRLIAALRTYLLFMPRGALGVQMGIAPGMPGMGIRIDDLVPGLPAEKVLRVGDRILNIDGRPMRQLDDLQSWVQAKRPGDKVRLVVRRAVPNDDQVPVPEVPEGPWAGQPQEQVLEIEMELGSSELLRRQNGVGQVSPLEYQRQVEAERCKAAYAPPPRELRIKGGAEAMFVASPSAMADFNGDLDADAAIRTLMMQRDLIARGELTDDRDLRAKWDLQRRRMLQEYSNPELSADRRAYLRRLIMRFSELMRE